MAVGRRTRDRLGAKIAAGARPVLNDKWRPRQRPYCRQTSLATDPPTAHRIMLHRMSPVLAQSGRPKTSARLSALGQ